MNKSSVLLLSAWIFFMALISVIYITIPPSPDQSIFDYIAWLSTKGLPYYSQAFDVSWPGKIVLHEVGVRIFGVHSWTWRATDSSLLAISTLAGAVFLGRSGFRSAPMAFLFLYPILYTTSGQWMAGQRDIVAAGLVVCAAALLLHPRDRPQLLGFSLFVAGALLAFVTLIRPTYLTFFGCTVLLMLVNTAWKGHAAKPWQFREALILVVGFVVIIAIACFLSLRAGNLDDWFEQTVRFNLEIYTTSDDRTRLIPKLISQLSQSWHWITMLALLGALFWRRASGNASAFFLVLFMIFCYLLSYFVRNKGFAYHLSGLLPVFALLIAAGIDGCYRLYRRHDGLRRRIAGGLLASVVGLTIAGSLAKLSALSGNVRHLVEEQDFRAPAPVDISLSTEDLEAVLNRINGPETDQDKPILVVGWKYEVAFLARRLPATRFVNQTALRDLEADSEIGQRWIADFSRSVTANPPEFVLIDDDRVNDLQNLDSDESVSDSMAGALKELISKGYVIDLKLYNSALYKLSRN